MKTTFRITRVFKYTSLVLAAVLTLILPLVIVEQNVGLVYALIWSSILLLGSSFSLYGTLRKRWTGEYIGLPAVTSSLFFLACVLIVVAIVLPYSPLTVARFIFGLLFLGFTFSTAARWGDVRFQKRLADYENRKKIGKSGL